MLCDMVFLISLKVRVMLQYHIASLLNLLYVCLHVCMYNYDRVLAAVQANEAKTNATQLPGSTDTTISNPEAKSGLLAPLASHTVGAVAVLALLYKPKQIQHTAPTVASTPTPNKTTVHVASVGDCRCVLSRGGQAVAVTDDHKVREIMLLCNGVLTTT
jgi:Protein phosphatase 2C